MLVGNCDLQLLERRLERFDVGGKAWQIEILSNQGRRDEGRINGPICLLLHNIYSTLFLFINWRNLSQLKNINNNNEHNKLKWFHHKTHE